MVPTSLGGRRPDRRQAERQPGPDDHRRRSRASSTRSSTRPPGVYEAIYAVDETAPAISNVAAPVTASGTRDDHLGHRRAVGLPGRLRHRPRLTDLEPEQLGPGHLPQRPAHRPRTEHDLLLPRVLERRGRQLVHRSPPAGQAPRNSPRLRDLQRHHRRRLQRRTSGCEHRRLADRRRRGHPDADRGRGVLRRPGPAVGLASSTWESQGGGAGGSAASRAERLHVDGACAGRPRPTGPGRSLEFVADLRRPRASSTPASPSTSTAPTGRSSASRTHGSFYARTNNGRPPTRHAAPGLPARLAAPLPDRVGARTRSATTSTGPWSRPTPRTFGTADAADRPATSTPAAPSSRSTGCI